MEKDKILSSPAQKKRGGKENVAWSLCLVISPALVKRGRSNSPKGELSIWKVDSVFHREEMLGSQKNEVYYSFPNYTCVDAYKIISFFFGSHNVYLVTIIYTILWYFMPHCFCLKLGEKIFINQWKYYKVYGRQDNKVFLF